MALSFGHFPFDRKVSSTGFLLGRFSFPHKVEMKSMLNELTYNIILTMVAGKRYYGDDVDVSNKEEAKQFREIMMEVFSYSVAANPADFLPILNWTGAGGYETKLRELGKRFDVFLQGLIDEHRGIKRNTMIDHLLSLQDSQPEYYTDQIIKGFIMVISTKLYLTLFER